MDTQALEKPPRSHRVNFAQPVRVVPIDGPPRAYRVFAGNLSRDGMFLKMAEPFEAGTRVALSLEARGRVLPFAQGEVVWRVSAGPEKHPMAGLGVRFTGFLHPRADELVDYLVTNIDSGDPLELAPEVPYWKRSPVRAVAIAAAIIGLLAGGMFALMTGGEAAESEDAVPVAEAPQPFAPAPLKPTVTVAPNQPLKVARLAEIDLTVAEPVNPQNPKEAPQKATANANVAKPTNPVPPVPAPASAQPTDRTVPLPKSSVKAVRILESADRVDLTFRLEPNASVVEVFRMTKPDRVVVDVSGRGPAKSDRVGISNSVVTAVRLGRGEKGTRLVFDLNGPMKVAEQKGNRVRLER